MPSRPPIAPVNSGWPTQVIAIGSGKGGVGKSTTTVNLAAALVRQGHSVGLLDADVWGFSIPRMLGLSGQPKAADGLIQPPEAFGVKVISIGLFTNEDNPVVWRGPMLHKALQQFLEDVAWDDPDYLLVDLPPGTGDISISIAQFLPGASMIVVTTPQAAAERVAQRAGFMAEKSGLQVAGVIENMSYFRSDDGKRYEIFGAGGGQSLADRLGVLFAGGDPPRAQAPRACRQGLRHRHLRARLRVGSSSRAGRQRARQPASAPAPAGPPHLLATYSGLR